MLVLSRKLNQSIMIGDDVEIIIVSVDRDQVKLGIKAPREIAVHRSEVYLEIQRANESAVSGSIETNETGNANPAVLYAAPVGKSVKKPVKQEYELKEHDIQEVQRTEEL